MEKFLENNPIDTTENSNNVNVIKFTDGDKNFCQKITGKKVKIICSTGDHDHGSSKVKLKNIVDYKWEIKKYPGHLIAVHMDGKHIAYVIKVNNKQSGTEEGMVRVVNIQAGQRALIKGITGEVLDVQFAHIERVHILACIDLNSLYVHKIDMLSDNLICNLLLKIEDPMDIYNPKYNKISWCPFYQEEFTSSDDEGEDASQLIVWSRGKIFQCFDVNIIINSHGIGKHNPKDLTDGYVQSIDNSIIITWTSLSPDGTTLSIGSEDGFIRFYQIYFHEKQPRCLHQWRPHNGKPISSFFFLDNYLKKSSSDTFWKHSLTGSNNNTEFKIWDCGTWECLQQIQLLPAPLIDMPFDKQHDQKSQNVSDLNLTAEIDITSSYLVLSNVESRMLYILQIVNNASSSSCTALGDIKTEKTEIGDTKKKRKNLTYIRSVSEYPISSSILSYSIVNATIRKLYKCTLNDSYLLDDIDYDYDEESMAISCVVVRMFVVQPKSVQECHILYQPINSGDNDDHGDCIDELSDDDGFLAGSDIKNVISDDDNIIDVTKIPYKDVLVSGYTGIKLSELSNSSSVSLLIQNNSNDDIGGVSTTEKSSNSDNGDNEKQVQKIRVVDDSILFIKGRKSPSPLIPGLEAPQSSTIMSAASIDEIQLTKNIISQSPLSITSVPPTSINHAQKSHFSQVNLMTPDSFCSSTSTTLTTNSLNIGALGTDKKTTTTESVNSDVLSTILMLASVTGSQNSKQNAENLNLLNLMNNKMIEDQEYQKQLRKTAEKIAAEKIQQNKNKFSLDNDNNDDDDDEIDDEDSRIIQNNSGNLTSGGSSPPSREVQEIMSLNECKLSNYLYNEQQDIASVDNLQHQQPENFLNTNEIINSKTQQLINNANSAGASTNIKNNDQNIIVNEYKNSNNKENNDKDKSTKNIKNHPSADNLLNWPKVPYINTIVHKKQQYSTNDKTHNTTAESAAAAATSSVSNNTTTSPSIVSKIDQLINVVHDLQQEINSLKMHKDTINSINNKQYQSNFTEFTRQTERHVLQLFEQYIIRYDKELRMKFDEFIQQCDVRNRELRDRVTQANQIFFNQLYEKISQTIKIEIQRNVIPVLIVKLDAIQGQMQSEVSAKLITTDQALRENISQLCKSKSIIETFGKSVLLGVQGSLQAAFIESMSSTLIPAYEKSSQNMFRQLHETFSIGIKQVMEQFDNYLTQLQPVQDTTDEILTRCVQFREFLDTNLNRQTTTIKDSVVETKKEIKTLEINFMRHFSELLKKEIRNSFEQQAASLEDSVLSAVRSRTNTPAPSSQGMSVYDVQDQIKHLLSIGQINAAFHQALLANDLSLVEYAIEKADYKTVFNPCTLEQTVLLSLIQQISADMSNHNDTKQQYLADGILNLIPTDPITKEHAPKVMKELLRNCQKFLGEHPQSLLCSNIRMIIMAIQGMGYKY